VLRPPSSARAFFRDPVAYLEDVEHGRRVVALGAPSGRFVLVRDPELVWSVLVSDSASFAPGKWKRRARRFVGSTLNTLDGEAHRRRRALLQPPLDRRRIAAHREQIRLRAEEFSDRLGDGARLSVRDALEPFALELAGHVLLSTDLRKRAPELARDLAQVMTALPRLTPPMPGTAGSRALTRVADVVDQLVAAHRQGDEDDLLGVLLRSGLPQPIVRGEVIAFLLAAVDEPPSALEAAVYLLGRSPAVDTRLEKELRGGEDGPYLEAVLRETLRLFPPARHIDRCPVRDVTIADARVAAGTNVLVSPLVTHRDTTLYGHASHFEPERWLVESRPAVRGAYVPFGAGPHTCIGEPLAWLMMTAMLGAISRRWRLRVDPDAAAPAPRSPRLVVTVERR
jgi:cytochrome P450